MSRKKRAQGTKKPSDPPRAGLLLVGNLGEPIHLEELKIHGVSASAAREGEKVQIWTRLVLTSDERMFHRIAQNLSGVIEHATAQ